MNKFYNQIDEVLISYEEHKPYHTKDMDWACNRIEWAWKWKKISFKEMEALADRACKILNKEI